MKINIDSFLFKNFNGTHGADARTIKAANLRKCHPGNL